MDSAGTPYARYLTSQFTKPDGSVVEPFSFTNNATNIFNLNEGVWTWDGVTPATVPVPEYDADPDGDGVKEAIWMDLGFPLQECDGKLFFKTLFSVKALDADGLLNLNVAGNTTGTRFIPSGDFDPTAGFRFNQSNQALSPSQLNLAQLCVLSDALKRCGHRPGMDFVPGDVRHQPGGHRPRHVSQHGDLPKLPHIMLQTIPSRPQARMFYAGSAAGGTLWRHQFVKRSDQRRAVERSAQSQPQFKLQPGTPGADDDGDENQKL